MEPLVIPKIENIHTKVLEAASVPDALDMSTWHHSCGTTHCWGGHITNLAGPAGKELESRMGMPLAAQLILHESTPHKVRLSFFYETSENALAEMKRLAGLESAEATA